MAVARRSSAVLRPVNTITATTVSVVEQEGRSNTMLGGKREMRKKRSGGAIAVSGQTNGRRRSEKVLDDGRRPWTGSDVARMAGKPLDLELEIRVFMTVRLDLEALEPEPISGEEDNVVRLDESFEEVSLP
jgi:hypothetical protein